MSGIRAVDQIITIENFGDEAGRDQQAIDPPVSMKRLPAKRPQCDLNRFCQRFTRGSERRGVPGNAEMRATFVDTHFRLKPDLMGRVQRDGSLFIHADESRPSDLFPSGGEEER